MDSVGRRAASLPDLAPPASLSTRSIADLVRDCLNAFQQLLAEREDIPVDKVQDELGRFRIWASNVSAHSSGRRSLQYRLRDSSELSETVIRYLAELLRLLRDRKHRSKSNLLLLITVDDVVFIRSE